MAVSFSGRFYDEDRESLEAAQAWAAQRVCELGVATDGLEYAQRGKDLIAEFEGGGTVTISPRSGGG